MGKRGPAPKPTVLRILEGNPSKRPINKNEPKPKPEMPKCPHWLDKEAKREWKRVAPELHRLGLLTVVDRTALAAYCQLYARWRKAEEAIRGKGMSFKTESGYESSIPEIKIAERTLQLIKAFCAEFGMTPSSRGSMQLPGQKEEDEFDKLLD